MEGGNGVREEHSYLVLKNCKTKDLEEPMGLGREYRCAGSDPVKVNKVVVRRGANKPDVEQVLGGGGQKIDVGR
jgi:hypothetical protein